MTIRITDISDLSDEDLSLLAYAIALEVEKRYRGKLLAEAIRRGVLKSGADSAAAR